MHHRGIVLTGEDVACAAHIRRKLVDIHDVGHSRSDEIGITKVANDEFIGGGLRVFMPLDINATYPEALGFKPLDEMSADKTTCSHNQYALQDHCLLVLCIWLNVSDRRLPDVRRTLLDPPLTNPLRSSLSD